MIDYYYSSQIKQMDSRELKNCKSHLELITKVGRAIAKHIINDYAPKSVSVFCGKGNNGRDGLLTALFLSEHGIDCTVITVDSPVEEYHKIISDYNGSVEVQDIDDTEEITHSELVIDAILGIGQNRPIEGKTEKAVRLINNSGITAVAIDVPTGISSDTGAILGCAVKVHRVYTITVEKPGLIVYPAKEYIDKITTIDVGIKTDGHIPVGHTLERVEFSLPRFQRSNKGSYGRVVCFVGSRDICGAAYLCSHAAYLSGAGLVEIVTHANNRIPLATLLPEAILTCYDDNDNTKDIVLSSLKRANSVVLGCGLGTDTRAVEITRCVCNNCNVPQVYDADAINIMAKYKFAPSNPHLAIYTPHMKEFERLTDVSVKEISNSSLSSCIEFSQTNNLICLLKDARTVIADANGKFFINTTGNNGMSTGGSGDVLAGIIGGLAAYHCDDLFKATANAAFIHGKAGDLAKEQVGVYSLTARDILKHIPEVLKSAE